MASASSSSGSSNYIPEASGSSLYHKLESIPSTSRSILLNNNGVSPPVTITTKTRRVSTTNRMKATAINNGGSHTFERECEAINRFEEECNNLVSHSSATSGGKGKGKAIMGSASSVSNIWCNLHSKEEKVLRDEFESE